MYDNISVEQSGKGLGHILKTSCDLSMAAVIANARQGENVSLLWATVSRPVMSGTEEKEPRKAQFQVKKSAFRLHRAVSAT